MISRFFIYGITGWVIEILWTAAGALKRGDKRMIGYTYLWMLPIYGFAIMLEPLCDTMGFMPFYIRGLVYMVCIFSMEYVSGYFIEMVIGQCPWDYSKCKYNIFGFIRIDYAPCWFILGLIFEMGYKSIA